MTTSSSTTALHRLLALTGQSLASWHMSMTAAGSLEFDLLLCPQWAHCKALTMQHMMQHTVSL